MSDLPDTSSEGVALASVAWELMKRYGFPSLPENILSEERLRLATNTYIKVLVALEKRAPIPESNPD